MSAPLRICGICGEKAIEIQDLKLFVKRPKEDFGRANLCKKCQAKAQRENKADFLGPKTITDLQAEQEAMLTRKAFQFKRQRHDFVTSAELGRRFAYFAGIPLGYGPRLLKAFRMLVTDALEHKENLYFDQLFRLKVGTKPTVVTNRLPHLGIESEAYLIKQPQQLKMSTSQHLKNIIQMSEAERVPFVKQIKDLELSGQPLQDIATEIKSQLNAYVYSN